MKTFSCFVALFPQLIAGPIIRYNTVAEQLKSRVHNFEKFSSGASIFILGFAKKILLANACGEVANATFRADALDAPTAWIGIFAYHLQIYFDFCAYSDMAVGLGRMMGFEFIKNFNGPYWSQSISDFWNRWHISLSTWIRDYLYISLGGNRKGPRRTYVNLGIAMFLCGLWHGAQMTFVIWGVFHGALLIWERTMGRQSIYRALPLPFKILITNVIVMFGWVAFRSPSMDQAVLYWQSMLGLGVTNAASDILYGQVFSMKHLIALGICSLVVFQPFQAHEWVKNLTFGKYIVLVIIFIYSIAAMFTNSFNPFLYFQF
jgi:alginate O-acetyltransferase complex protein AlgI